MSTISLEDITTEEKLASANHWDALADSEDRQADWEDSLGQPYGCTNTFRNRSNLYRKTAKVIRLEVETGKPHCMYCLGDHPTADHSKHI